MCEGVRRLRMVMVCVNGDGRGEGRWVEAEQCWGGEGGREGRV